MDWALASCLCPDVAQIVVAYAKNYILVDQDFLRQPGRERLLDLMREKFMVQPNPEPPILLCESLGLHDSFYFSVESREYWISVIKAKHLFSLEEIHEMPNPHILTFVVEDNDTLYYPRDRIQKYREHGHTVLHSYSLDHTAQLLVGLYK